MTRIDRRKLLTTGAFAAAFAGAGMPVGARPKRGGLLRAGVSGGTATDWDARRPWGLAMAVCGAGAVFDTLTEVAPDGSLRGELATRWEALDGATRWALELRRDAMFHNGKPLEATDVIASLALHGPGTAGWAVMRRVASMQPRGRHALDVTLHAPDADFPYLLSDYHLVIYPGDDITGAMAQGIGTGLYRTERLAEGRLEARRVRDHDRGETAGWFDEIEIRALDGHAAQQALANRQVDVIDGEAEARAVSSRIVTGQPYPGVPEQVSLPPFADYVVSAHERLALPRVMGNLWPLDNARLAERWWMA
ncbi:ABC transporter substrate-binding protein [Mesobacterium pallidum]|uniref:ABC transporter substrate-binding protein n=1 Tax=Mesobacterium pallidum TaxID=2872037 RepID=UPI001EE218B0|nr:ABC transporter substrate-binding protein [Mesobacterium pallidum]